MENVIDNQTKQCFPEKSLSLDSSKLTQEDLKKPCKKYDSNTGVACGAPLCALFGWVGIFYSDEEICTNPKCNQVLIVRNQRKIARKSKDFETYFTATMLNRNIIVKAGIRGLNPDHELKDMEREEREWLKAHPVKKPLSDKELSELRERFSKVQGKQPDKKTA